VEEKSRRVLASLRVRERTGVLPEKDNTGHWGGYGRTLLEGRSVRRFRNTLGAGSLQDPIHNSRGVSGDNLLSEGNKCDSIIATGGGGGSGRGRKALQR